MTESSRDDRINKVIADYLAAADKGELPDQQAVLARYPDLAADLQAFFRDQAQMQRFAAGLAPGTDAHGSPVSDATVDLGGRRRTGDDTIARTEPSADLVAPLGTVRYFGDYELLEEIARGGMGVVYKARQVRLNRIVAVKMILAGQLASEADVKRFYAEAEAAADLQHPNIVAIHEVGEHEGQHYFSMDYIEGKSLAAIVREQPLPALQAARYVRLIAEAIQHAHDKGILHRDLKPSNVLVDTADQPRVTDFGLAKRNDGGPGALATGGGLTVTGQVVGTPGYMPPEQARGERVGPWADVYSLGAILYELLTGRAPFVAANVLDTLTKVINAEPESPRRYQANVPRDLETICLKCLQKEPAARYTSAAALAEDLRRFQAGEPIVARPVGRLERTVKWARRHPAQATVAIMAVALLGVVGVGGALASLWLDAEAAKQSAETAYAAEQNAKTLVSKAFDAEQMAKVALEKANQALTISNLAEKIARSEADVAKEEVKRLLYLHSVALAWKEHEAGNPARVRDLLAECQDKYRHWEWYHLDLKIPRELAGFSLKSQGKFYGSHVSFSSDCRRVAATSDNKTIKLWDTSSGKELATVKHKDVILSVVFSPDGRCLASACLGGTVKLVDGITGKELTTVNKASGQIAFSPDSRWLASGSGDNAVKIWDAANGDLLATLEGHTQELTHVSFNHDGKQLASASYDMTVKLWDTGSRKALATFSGHKRVVSFLSFSPDGRRLASASHTVKLWDTVSGKELASLVGHKSTVAQVIFSPDGNRLATSSFDKTVKVWETASGKELANLPMHMEMFGGNQVAFSPDGAFLATTHDDGAVRLWDTTAGKEMGIVALHKQKALHVSFFPDGQRLATGSVDGTAKFWDAAAGRETVTLIGHKKYVRMLRFSPDNRRLASASHDGKVKIWDAATGVELASLQGHFLGVDDVIFSPNGSRLAGACHDGGTVKLWDATTYEELATFKAPKVKKVKFSPDSQRLGAASLTGVRLWDAVTNKELAKLQEPTGNLYDMGFSPDGLTIAGQTDKHVVFWDAISGKQLHTVAAPLNYAEAPTTKLGTAPWNYEYLRSDAMFSPDGTRFADGLDLRGGNVKIRDIATNMHLATLARSSKSGGNHEIFSPDGQTVAAATGFENPVIQLWFTKVDAETWSKRKLVMQEQQATEACDARQWFAAAFHLRQLLKQRPNDPDLQTRLHHAEAELKKDQDAKRK